MGRATKLPLVDSNTQQVDPVDRINFLIFWNLAMLLQEISNRLSAANPDFQVASEDTIVDLLTLAPTSNNARDHPIFQQLEACLDKLNVAHKN